MVWFIIGMTNRESFTFTFTFYPLPLPFTFALSPLYSLTKTLAYL